MSESLDKKVILVPTYNEAGNLETLVSKILALSLGLDILVIDDNSPDGTGEMAERMSHTRSFVKVLHRVKKEGLGRAYRDGFLWALQNKYDVILQMDADLSHDPAALPEFLKEIQNCDAVFGSRYLNGVRVQNWSFKRLVLSKVSNEFVRIVLGLPATDTTTAYKCFRRKVIEAVDWKRLRGRQNAFLIELVWMTVKNGFRTKEIPFTFTERESGESKMNLKVAAESLGTVFRLFFLGLGPARSRRAD